MAPASDGGQSTPGRKRPGADAPSARRRPGYPSVGCAPAEPTSGALNSELWPKVLVLIKSQNNSLCALLQMYPVDFADGEVTIKPRFNFHRDLFLKPSNRTMVETAAAKVYGRSVKMHARTEENGGGGTKKRTPKPDPSSELMSSALEILGGEIVE